MLRVSVALLLLGITLIILSHGGKTGISFEEGRLVFFASLTLSILTFFASLLSPQGGRRRRPI